LRGELQRLVNATMIHSAGNDLSSEYRFLHGSVQLFGWVTQELVAHSIHEKQQQQQQQQGRYETVFSLVDWLVNLLGTNDRNLQHQQQRVSEFLAQITDYTTLLIDYAQDELDQACSCRSLTVDDHIESAILLQRAIDLILEAYVLIENLQAWEPPEDLAGNMRILWQTLAQANISKTEHDYEVHYLPALVRLTQSILVNQPDDIDLSIFIGVFLRLVPYADLWIDADEIWSHLQSHAPTLQRLLQLVLLTFSSPARSAEKEMCHRLQELLPTDGNGNNNATSMADLYFTGNYTPVMNGAK